MLIRTTKQNIEKAFEITNKEYEGNLTLTWNNKKGNFYSLKMEVNNSFKYGARVSHSGRRIAAASWQAFRDFFTEIYKLDENAAIRTALAKYDNKEDFEYSFPGTEYTNIGSLYNPVQIGETAINEDGSKPDWCN